MTKKQDTSGEKEGGASPPKSEDRDVDALLNDIKRIQADYENFRKQVDRDIQRAKDVGFVKAVEQLLPVLDELSLAEKHISGLPKDSRDGLIMLFKKIRDTFKKMGVVEISPKGKPYDPYSCEVVSQVPGDADGIVVEVMRKGYKYKNTIIRPAMVVVSVKKDEK